jgi:UPF0716 family protein affecting phage T7 exclusion
MLGARAARLGATIEWGKVPWTLWVYAASTVAGMILLEVETHGKVTVKVLFPFLTFAYLFFLFKGVRWLWIATLVVLILGLVVDLIVGPVMWRGILTDVIGPVLLLLPVTRRYFAGKPKAANTQFSES